MTNGTEQRSPLDLTQYQAVLLDLDGTVYHEDHALPGAVDLIRRLQAAGQPYACLTNSTTSPGQLVSRLKRMGVDVDPAHIYTAAAAACDYVLQRFGGAGTAAYIGNDDARDGAASGPHHKPRILNISTSGVEEMLDGKVVWVKDDHAPCDAVICGVPLNVYATEDRLRAALVQLRRGNAELVAICADRVYPSPRGLEFGVGAFAAMFGYAANKKPIFCGKPEPLFFTELCRRLGVRAERCVLVGDNLESDIAGAKGVGMKTILTLTGVATRYDADHAPLYLKPDGVVDSLASL